MGILISHRECAPNTAHAAHKSILDNMHNVAIRAKAYAYPVDTVTTNKSHTKHPFRAKYVYLHVQSY